MLVQRSNPVTPLTPVTTPPGPHLHASADLSPRSSNSSFGSSSASDGVLHHHESLHSPRTEEFSALQQLQFALARDGLFSSMTFDHVKHDQGDPKGMMLVKPCTSSSSSSVPHSPSEDANDERVLTSSPSSNGVKTGTPMTSPSDANSTNIFECPLCSVVCNSRHDFNDHLVTHSQQFVCPKCSFFSDDETKLKEHVTESHDINDLDGLTDEDVRTPKTNSQGKMKTFKCKQCGYHAVTKMDFWEHTKGHIRTEKMLTCPKCPFVTEYKHHLEYHLRNHFGSKPFQCTKCSYSCVNKSMLNSHLKSHSNIYQYRCADCAYATKYCHSLKLHLRKYDHKPSMVLNPDGTPNPLPIIDVYGTRRGPKIKRQDPESVDMGSTTLSPVTPKEKSKNQRAPRRQKITSVPLDRSIKTSNTPPISPEFSPRDIKQEFATSPSVNRHMSPTGMSVDEKPFIINKEHTSANLLMQKFPQGIPMSMATSINTAGLQQLLMQTSVNGSVNAGPNLAALQNLMMQASVNGPANSGPNNLAVLQSLMMQNSANLQGLEFLGKSPMELYANALQQYMAANNPVMNVSSPMELAKLVEEQRTRLMAQLHHQQQQQSPTLKTSESLQRSPPQHLIPMDMHALDLRNPKRPAETSSETANEDAKKRKRKGKALRYDRNKEEYDMSNKIHGQVLDFSNNNYTATNNNVKNITSKVSQNEVVDSENYVCPYCDIAFPPVLYALHMRFHSSDSDPFRCNVCGTKSSDKVSFFVHLATASH